jgi:hypothetical protein
MQFIVSGAPPNQHLHNRNYNFGVVVLFAQGNEQESVLDAVYGYQRAHQYQHLKKCSCVPIVSRLLCRGKSRNFS